MSKHKRRKVMPKYRKPNIPTEKLKCYIEEYGDNNARLRDKQSNKKVIIADNGDGKQGILGFLSQAKQYKFHAPSMFDKDGKDYIDVIGTIEKEDDDDIYIKAIILQFRKTDITPLSSIESSNLERPTTEDDIDREVDALFSLIECIEDKYHTILIGERNNINRAYYDLIDMPYSQTMFVFSNWKKGILERYKII